VVLLIAVFYLGTGFSGIILGMRDDIPAVFNGIRLQIVLQESVNLLIIGIRFLSTSHSFLTAKLA